MRTAIAGTCFLFSHECERSECSNDAGVACFMSCGATCIARRCFQDSEVYIKYMIQGSYRERTDSAELKKGRLCSSNCDGTCPGGAFIDVEVTDRQTDADYKMMCHIDSPLIAKNPSGEPHLLVALNCCLPNSAPESIKVSSIKMRGPMVLQSGAAGSATESDAESDAESGAEPESEEMEIDISVDDGSKLSGFSVQVLDRTGGPCSTTSYGWQLEVHVVATEGFSLSGNTRISVPTGGIVNFTNVSLDLDKKSATEQTVEIAVAVYAACPPHEPLTLQSRCVA